MDRINELMQNRAKLWEDAKAFLDSHADKNGMLSAEDEATYDKMETDIASMGKQIDRLSRQAAIDSQLAAAVSTPLVSKPEKVEEEKGYVSPFNKDYGRNFWNAMRNKDASPIIRNALQVGTDTEGGFLVPDEFESKIIMALQESNVMRSLANVMRTSHGDRKIPIAKQTGEAAWIEEEALVPESDDAFGQIHLNAYKLAALIKVSEELLNDAAFDVEAYISTQFANKIAVKEEDAFINGDGVNKPTGILHESAGAEVGVTTADVSPTLDEVIDLYYSLKAPYRRKAVWLANDSTVKALRKVKDKNGNYLWHPSLVVGNPDTLLGKPIITSPSMPDIVAGAKPIAFGDFSHYWIAERQNRIFKKLNELYATTGQVGFMATERIDGKLTLPEAIKVLKIKA